jgi:excinuclease ABC subunit C
VRDKVSVEEGDFSHMLAGFEIELGELNTITVDNQHLLAYSKGIKFLKSEQQALEQMMNNFFDSYLVATSFEGENFYNDLLTILQKKYHLKNFPYRMECIDISHFSGDWISGGLSCMVGGILEKKGYRKYKIRSVKGQSDDYASLAEVITRRLLKSFPKNPELAQSSDVEQSPTISQGEDSFPIWPSVVILDGGKGQLGVVKKLYDEHEKFRQLFNSVDFIALGKGEARKKSAIGSRSARSLLDLIGERIYRFDENWNIIEIPLLYDQADKLLIKLRDEAHRFSNYYRKQQMKEIGKKTKTKN